MSALTLRAWRLVVLAAAWRRLRRDFCQKCGVF